MEHWLFLPQHHLSIDQVVDVAQAAESSGYVGIALIDHMVTPLAEHTPLYEAMTLATWVAARTTSLRIGHLVLCDAFRDPVVLAKQAVTLDHASGGRFELGIGWGSWPRELTGFGVTESTGRERAARLVDSVATLRRLWAGEPAVEGGLTQTPLPLGRLPLVVGGVGPTALTLAREHADWWNVTAPKIDRIPELRGKVAPARVSAQVMVALDRPDELPGAPLERAKRQFSTFPTGIIGGSVDQVHAEIAALDVERVYVWLSPPQTSAAVEAFADGVMRR